MTSGDERSESPENPSGERSDPGGSGNPPGGNSREARTGNDAARERSEDDRRESSEGSSGEERRDDPRDSEDDRRGREPPENAIGEPSERSEESKEADPKRTDGGADGIPLNIAGHEDEERRPGRGAAEGTLPGADADGDASGEDAVLSEFDVSEPDSEEEAVEPVELLVQLAEDGEIDPWDIDVVRVTDKFLDRLDESDLRTGGRALFYASVLLRMKSDAMWIDEDEDEEWEEEPWETPAGEPPDGAPAVDPFEQLEREMDRRIERKRARGMPETLDELVRDLRERERDTWWKESRSYDTSESPSGYARGTQTLDYRGGDDLRMDEEPTADDVTGTAHDEHMEDVINDVYVELQRHYEGGRDEVLFAEIREAGGDTVTTFLGVLFLAHRGQVRLQQDEFFGDLWVRDPAAPSADEAAPADD